MPSGLEDTSCEERLSGNRLEKNYQIALESGISMKPLETRTVCVSPACLSDFYRHDKSNKASS